MPRNRLAAAGEAGGHVANCLIAGHTVQERRAAASRREAAARRLI
jgi:hypothetical protein